MPPARAIEPPDGGSLPSLPWPNFHDGQALTTPGELAELTAERLAAIRAMSYAQVVDEMRSEAELRAYAALIQRKITWGTSNQRRDAAQRETKIALDAAFVDYNARQTAMIQAAYAAQAASSAGWASMFQAAGQMMQAMQPTRP